MVAWWTPEESSVILGYFGAAVGVSWGLLGLGSVLASKGKAKVFVTVMGGALVGIGAFGCCGAFAALLLGQPSHVVQPLSLGGALIGGLGLVITVITRKRYAESEQRRLGAATLRRG